MIWVEPSLLRELISETPAMEPKACSSGVATLEAMVSGLAPGKLAEIAITGKSISGKDATGKSRKASAPTRTIASASRLEPTGRKINSPNKRFMSTRVPTWHHDG